MPSTYVPVLSRPYNPADLDPGGDLQPFDRTAWVDGQASQLGRRWEYALAACAIEYWRQTTGGDAQPHYDVGGAGSRFAQAYEATVIDPKQDPYVVGGTRGFSLQQFVGPGTALAAVVTCLSVLEHVEDLEDTCYRLDSLVAPGGLLVLTVDFAPEDGPDVYHFHWDRRRIFTPTSLTAFLATWPTSRWHLFGTVRDRQEEEPVIPLENWGYAPISLVLQKRA